MIKKVETPPTHAGKGNAKKEEEEKPSFMERWVGGPIDSGLSAEVNGDPFSFFHSIAHVEHDRPPDHKAYLGFLPVNEPKARAADDDDSPAGPGATPGSPKKKLGGGRDA